MVSPRRRSSDKYLFIAGFMSSYVFTIASAAPENAIPLLQLAVKEHLMYKSVSLNKFGTFTSACYSNSLRSSFTFATFWARRSAPFASARNLRYGSVFEGLILNHHSGNSTLYPSKSKLATALSSDKK